MTKARALAVLMFAVFLATSFRKGWTRNETDFPNYYTAAVLVRQGALCANTTIGRGFSGK